MRIYVAISNLYRDNDEFNFWCLSRQTDLDFTVILLDFHHDEGTARRVKMYNELFPVWHVRYRVPDGSRMFDWGQWNTPVLLAENEDDFVFRYQNWRLIPSNTIAEMKRAKVNTGFIRTDPMVIPPSETMRFSSTSQVPDIDKDVTPAATYGDWCMRVRDYLLLNGIDEPATMNFHWEDIDFEIRWRIAMGNDVPMEPWVRWKSWALYMAPASREAWLQQNNLNTDTFGKKSNQFKKPPCYRCSNQWPELQAINDRSIGLHAIPNREGVVDLGVVYGKRWFYCSRCDSVVMHTGTPHFSVDHQGKEYRATVGLMGKWGRNLRLARERCLSYTDLDNRLEYAAMSYWNTEAFHE